MQAGTCRDARELRIGGLGGDAIIADEVTDDRAISLFDVRTIVFLPGATAGKGDAVPLAVDEEMVVDELGAVVAVQADERHRQELAHPMDGSVHAVLALAPDGLQLDPWGESVTVT